MNKLDSDFVDEYYAGKDLSLLKKLTLIIPTYNRNYYLSRCLWYHAHFPFGEIIVADSSPEDKKVVNREIVSKIQSLFGSNIRYLEYETEIEKYGGDIYRKWGYAVQYVDTKYSQICTDKELTVPTTLCALIKFLDTNKDYVVASGTFVNYSGNINLVYRGRTSITNKDVLPRYCKSLESGWTQSQLLSMYRSDVHKEIYQPIIAKSISDIRFGERYISFIGYAYGKMHHTDLPYNLRDVSRVVNDDKSINLDESSTLRYPQLNEYDVNSDYYKHSYNGCHKEILKILSEKGPYNRDELEKTWTQIISPIITRVPMSPKNRFIILYRIAKKIIPNRILTRYNNSITIAPNNEYYLILRVLQSYRKYNDSDSFMK